jgi:hypothetical protein
MANTPHSWDPHAVRVAVAKIQGLVDGFVSDLSGEGVRNELGKVVEETIGLEGEAGIEEVGRRVGLLFYGAAILGAAAFALAAELGRETRTEVRAMAGEALNTWLDISLAA